MIIALRLVAGLVVRLVVPVVIVRARVAVLQGVIVIAKILTAMLAVERLLILKVMGAVYALILVLMGVVQIHVTVLVGLLRVIMLAGEIA